MDRHESLTGDDDNNDDNSKVPLHDNSQEQDVPASLLPSSSSEVINNNNKRKRSREQSSSLNGKSNDDGSCSSSAPSYDDNSINDNDENEFEAGAGAEGATEIQAEDDTIIEESSLPSFPSSLLSQFGTDVSWDDSSHGVDATVTFPYSDRERGDPNDGGSKVRLCLVGRAQISCLGIGDVEILGYRLSSSRNTDGASNGSRGRHHQTTTTVEVASPSWSSYITITQLDTSKPTKLKICSIYPNNNTDGVDSPLTNTKESQRPLHHPTFQLLHPTHSMARPTIIPNSWSRAVDEIERDIQQQQQQQQHHHQNQCRSRIVICGGKGVGKSTCLRYTVNRLLSSRNCNVNTVAIVDADVGQPELSPPGLLSLSTITSPLLHPPYMNLIRSNQRRGGEDDVTCTGDSSGDNITSSSPTTISSLFFGSVTSKVDPTRYIECVQYLISQYEQQVVVRAMNDGSDIPPPLVVNLDGWVKGMGYEILSALLTNTDNGGLCPTHIIQIIGETKAKIFDLTELVGNLSITTVSPPSLHVVGAFNNTAVGELTTNSTMTVVPSSVPSSSLRSIRFGSYFVPDQELWDQLILLDSFVDRLQHGWNDDKCEIAHILASERPYCVPFEAVQYCMVGTDCQDVVSEDMILKVLNGSFVGLCYDKNSLTANGPADGNDGITSSSNEINNDNDNDPTDQSPSRDNANNAAIGTPLHLLECLGLGLIRSIDPKRRLFYILTPVCPTKLHQVQTLVAGNLEVPLQFHFRGVHAESFPYLKINNDLHRAELQQQGGGTEGDTGDTNNNNKRRRPIGSDPMQSRNNIARTDNSRFQDN